MVRKALLESKSKAFPHGGEGEKQQYIAQNIYVSLFMIRGDKKCVDKYVRLLTIFSDVSRLEIN